MKLVCLMGAAALMICAAAASADVLWYQPTTLDIPSVSSQAFTDLGVNTRAFDDFTTGAASWLVTRVTVYGVDCGSAQYNTGVKMAFTAAADVSSIGVTFDGVQVGEDLVFDMPAVALAGDFWLTAWVERPSSGSQWFWDTSLPVTGSQFYWHNPDGFFGVGTGPVPGQNVPGINQPADLAFKIEGRLGCDTVIPEAPSLMLALSALPAIAASVRLRRRA